jgi:restriction endonuclease S subunit
VEELQELGTGATFSELSAGKLSNFEIQLPPINEQRKIVERYEKVEELQKSISLLNQERYFGVRSFFHSLRRTLLSAASLSAPLVALGDLCEILDSKRVPITKKDRVPGPYPYYGATGIVDYVANYIFDEALVLVGEDGAKWGADEGSAFLVEGKSWVNNHAHVLRPIASRVCQDWVVQCLNSMDLTEFVGGLTVPKLNQSALRKIVIPVPPIGVQEAILKKINAVSLVLEDVRPSSQNLQTSVSELGRTFLLDELEAA